MKITFSEPVVVAMGPDSRTAGWGVYQFPDLWRLTDGRLLYTFSNSADSAEAYGAELGCCVSSDNGKTWTRTTEKEVAHLKGIRLRNGDVVRFEEPSSVPLEGISLPEPLCTSRKGFSAYPIESVPEDVCNHSWLIHRINEAHPQGIFEPVKLNWPHMFTCSIRNVLIRPMPRGRLRIDPDGTLWMPHYTPVGISPEDGSVVSTQMSNYLLRSTDNGHTWDLTNFLPFHPATEEEEKSEGYNENDITFAPDGSMVRLIRTHVLYARAAHPMMITRSTDGGYTWTQPEPFDFTGVWPCLKTLKCGVTLATYGRPGLFLRATADPACMNWEDRIELIHSSGEPDVPGSVVNRGTCSYTDMIELDDHTVGLAYSDFRIPDENGVPRKTMMFRTVTVHL